jgi:putative ABC transport system ATP-binding protein
MVRVDNLHKIYQMATLEVHVLKGISLTIEKGAFVAIMGPSGSGKSTLMHILGCLDRPTRGTYCLDGHDVSLLSKDELAEIRNTKIGFVFQNFNLLPRETALQNVELPLIYNSTPARLRRRRAQAALALVGLTDRNQHYPSQLSGGQQQRVAIARAVVNEPSVILADEPTGNLDDQTSLDIMKLFAMLHAQGKTIIMITHEHDIAAHAEKTVILRDGNILDIVENSDESLGRPAGFLPSTQHE